MKWKSRTILTICNRRKLNSSTNFVVFCTEFKTAKRYDSIPSIWFMFISRLFSVVWGLADIYLWKGIWDGVDCFLCSECGENHKDWTVAISTFSIGAIILIIAGIKYIVFYRWLSKKNADSLWITTQ